LLFVTYLYLSELQNKIGELKKELGKPLWRQLIDADADANAIQHLQGIVRDAYLTFIVCTTPDFPRNIS
jgi:hypothetical protein